jgi:hypothetical protein
MKQNLTRMASAAAGLYLLVAPASATVVDFSDLGNGGGGAWGAVPQSFGDTHGVVNFTYRSLQGGNNWGEDANQSSGHVNYWSGSDFSHDDAIYAVKSTDKLQLRMDAGEGQHFTNVQFHFGGYPNTDQYAEYKVFDQNWSLLGSATNFFISGSTGALLALAPNSTSLVLQIGDTWNAGINWVSYTVAPNDVPLPAGVVFLLTGLLGIGGAGRMRKAAW